MKKNLIVSLFLAAGLFSSLNSYACDTCGYSSENLDFLKQKLVRYHDSGKYEQDIAAVDHKALQYLKNRIAHAKSPTKLAIILDIDETSLSNYRDMLDMHFGGTPEQIRQAENQGTDTAINPTLEIFRFAKAHNIAVFFVTGRYEKYRRSTANNLARVGFIHSEGLSMKPNDYSERSVVPYKSSARKAIADKGYTIILNLGDQQSDLAGGYSEKTFKVPNPYYYIP